MQKRIAANLMVFFFLVCLKIFCRFIHNLNLDLECRSHLTISTATATAPAPSVCTLRKLIAYLMVYLDNAFNQI